MKASENVDCNLALYNELYVKDLNCISLRNLYYSKDEHAMVEKNISDENRIVEINDNKSIDKEYEGSLTPEFLRRLNKHTLVDTFLTLHILEEKGQREVIVYVSEVQKCNMNPDFNNIIFPKLPKTHLIVLRVWAKYEGSQSWGLLLHCRLDLRKLTFIGDSLTEIELLLYNNTAIFRFKNSFFVVKDSIEEKERHQLVPRMRNSRETTHASYSIDSIRSLNSINESLEDLIISKFLASKRISSLIDALEDPCNHHYLDTRKTYLEWRTQLLDESIEQQRTEIDSLSSEIMSNRVKQNSLRQTLKSDMENHIKVMRDQSEYVSSQITPIYQKLRYEIFPSIFKHSSDLIHVLLEIFPITNFNSSIRFSILGIEFPSSIREILEICTSESEFSRYSYDIDTENKSLEEVKALIIDRLNSALSYIVQLALQISDITSIGLKYEMVAYGSASFIIDPTASHAYTPMKFPLFYVYKKNNSLTSANEEGMKFKRGLELLSKNLNGLMYKVTDVYSKFRNRCLFGTSTVPVDHLDNFLWDLQYLLLYVTAPL